MTDNQIEHLKATNKALMNECDALEEEVSSCDNQIYAYQKRIEELKAALLDVLDGQGWLSSGPWDIAEACGVSEERAAEIQNMIRAAQEKDD